MSKADVAKEKIAYLKLWLGIAIATGISLIGWLLANVGSAGWIRIAGGMIAIAIIASVIRVLHARIEEKLRELEDL